MEFVIIYFSGTGNTELIASQIKNRLEDKGHPTEVVSIEDKSKIKEIDFNNKILGFGYPVYKFSYPDILDDLITLLNDTGENNRYFQFSTYARFDADAFYDFSKKLDSQKFRLIAQKSFKAPSCGISCRLPIDDYEYQSVMFFEDEIDKRVDEFVLDIINSVTKENKVKQKYSPLSFIRKKVVEDIEITKYPKLQILEDRCTVCGLCARKCPENNFTLNDSSIGIKDDRNCLHCLRCMNHCPSNAIIFGELSRGNNRYTFKIRDLLYKKSAEGHREKYWAEFKKVIKKWQRNTLKYWLKNRANPK